MRSKRVLPWPNCTPLPALQGTHGCAQPAARRIIDGPAYLEISASPKNTLYIPDAAVACSTVEKVASGNLPHMLPGLLSQAPRGQALLVPLLLVLHAQLSPDTICSNLA
jgi:hypothetical protein